MAKYLSYGDVDRRFGWVDGRPISYAEAARLLRAGDPAALELVADVHGAALRMLRVTSAQDEGVSRKAATPEIGAALIDTFSDAYREAAGEALYMTTSITFALSRMAAVARDRWEGRLEDQQGV